jgi:hypothetical protein
MNTTEQNKLKIKILDANSSYAKKTDIDTISIEEQIRYQRLQNKRYESDTDDRKWLAKWAVITVSAYLSAVFIMLVFNGIYIPLNISFNISDNVLIALLVTTTANVLGLTFIVLKGHFNRY